MYNLNWFIHLKIIILYDFNVTVDDGAILDLILQDFVHPPAPGFEKIMVEQSLL